MKRLNQSALVVVLSAFAGMSLASPGHQHGSAVQDDKKNEATMMQHEGDGSMHGGHGHMMGDHKHQMMQKEEPGHPHQPSQKHKEAGHMMKHEEGHHGNGHHGMPHHGEGHHSMGHHGGSKAGKPGKEKHVDRVVHVEANDQMRFEHEKLQVKPGETIKFVVHNQGKIAHEFALGTKDEHHAHGQMMMKHPGMHHEEGGAAITLQPGETKELIWTFHHAEDVQVACNIPGHYAAGMHSPVMMKHD